VLSPRTSPAQLAQALVPVVRERVRWAGAGAVLHQHVALPPQAAGGCLLGRGPGLLSVVRLGADCDFDLGPGREGHAGQAKLAAVLYRRGCFVGLHRGHIPCGLYQPGDDSLKRIDLTRQATSPWSPPPSAIPLGPWPLFAIPSTSRWTAVAIIGRVRRTRSCTGTGPRASAGRMRCCSGG